MNKIKIGIECPYRNYTIVGGVVCRQCIYYQQKIYKHILCSYIKEKDYFKVDMKYMNCMFCIYVHDKDKCNICIRSK